MGLERFCKTYTDKTTTIHFPDHELVLPLPCWMNNSHQPCDKAEYLFPISVYFDLDHEIAEYIRDWYPAPNDRCPPDEGIQQVAFGTIYLRVYVDLSKCLHFEGESKSGDVVLFEFGTTGSQMSYVFYSSSSIRKTFTEMLETFGGLAGILDLEDLGGRLFWFKGKRLDIKLADGYLMPDEIETIINQGS